MDVKAPADQVATDQVPADQAAADQVATDQVVAPDADAGVRVLPLILGRWGPLGRPTAAGRRPPRPASRVRSRIGLIIAAAFLLLLVLWAIIPGVFAGADPTAVNPLTALTGPSVHNFFGTDQYGRSIYDELVYGTRPALEVGVGSTLLAAAVGSLVGIAGGFLGGWFDLLIMRLIDMLLALPGLLLALIFIAALPRTLTNEIFAIAIASIPIFARVLRGQTVQVRSRRFVDAAVVSGLRRRTIVIRHVIPNCVAPAVELATVYVGVAIVIAASLSFLGLGPSEVVPDWGTLIQSGQGYIDHDWWISVFPGVMVTLVVIALSVLGDRLRGAMEPVRG